MLAMQSAYGEPDLIGYLNLELYGITINCLCSFLYYIFTM
jgi:hypothetical protein